MFAWGLCCNRFQVEAHLGDRVRLGHHQVLDLVLGYAYFRHIRPLHFRACTTESSNASRFPGDAVFEVNPISDIVRNCHSWLIIPCMLQESSEIVRL